MERRVSLDHATGSGVRSTSSEERHAAHGVDYDIPNHVLPLAAKPEPVAAIEPAAALALTIDMPVEMRGEDIFLTQGDRRYRIRGLAKNMSYELLKVNVLVSGQTPRGEPAFHVDTLDLYSSRQRGIFMKQAADELGIKEEVIRRDLGRALMKLEELQDAQIKQALAPKEETVTLTEEEQAAAMELLRDPRLLERWVGLLRFVSADLHRGNAALRLFRAAFRDSYHADL